MSKKEQIIEEIRKIYDPEIPVVKGSSYYENRINRILKTKNSTIIFNSQYNKDKKELDILVNNASIFFK